MIADLFILIIYQPFLNLLVTIYWVLQQLTFLPHQDMGVAVIIFTVAFRIILLPVSLASSRSEKDRRRVEEKVKQLNQDYAHDPVRLKNETKQLFKDNPWTLAASAFDIILQACIAFMLWRIFAKGLEGADLHLLYPFTPHPPTPYDLTFWGIYDLSHSNMVLNLVQSFMIFIVEALNLWTSPYPVTRQDVIRLLIILPLVSFFIFMFLPAGKKLFIITTLTFTACLILFRQVRYLMHKRSLQVASATPAPEEAKTPPASPTVAKSPDGE